MGSNGCKISPPRSYKFTSPHTLSPNPNFQIFSSSSPTISHERMKFQFSHLFLLLISHLSIVSSHYYCHEHQKSALLHFFSTNFTSMLPLWTPHTDCCQWEGITCDPATGHVIAINVSQRFISGSINSSAFASLGSLLSLDLSSNLFGSAMPSNLSLLSNLTHLNLANAGFAGEIPAAEIARLNKLVALDLSSSSYVNLTLEKPSVELLLRNLSRLTQLHLDRVNMSSPLPKFLSNFTHLTSLRISSCDLVGEFPTNIFLLPKLETLDASSNGQLMGSLPDFPGESALQTLQLSYSGYSGSLPNSLCNLKNLTTLDLRSCDFSGPIPSLDGLTELQYLDLSYNNFSGPSPSLDGLAKLEHLDLSINHFSGQIPRLANLTRLTVLDLSQNHFSGWIPPLDSLKAIRLAVLDLSYNLLSGWIPPLDSLKAIRQIDLSSNNLTGEIPQSSGDGLHNLTVLNLGNNSLRGTIPSYLFSLSSLQELRLKDNQLGGQMNELGDFSSPLETIDLSHNNLEGQIPSSIFVCTSLRVLDLSSNRFNGSLDLVVLQNMKNLSFLSLSDNNLLLSGNADGIAAFPQLDSLFLASCKLTQFPYFLRNQSRLLLLDLSNNSIAGEIPNWMWSVAKAYLNLSHNSLLSLQQPHNLSSSSLAILDLHSNQLQGEIPRPSSSITVLDYSKNNFTSNISPDFAATLVRAMFLYLSSNNISGEIPSTLCGMNSLQVLDLSDNQLSGSIPNCVNDLDLQVLNLRNNHLTGIIPSVSSEKNCSLRTLNLNGNQLEGKIPESLSYCGDLEVLDVGNNRLSSTFPSYISTLSKLRVLVLRSNRFSGSLCHSCNFSFPMLQIIDLSNNSFGGILPAHFIMSLNAMMSAQDDEDADVPQVRFIQYSISGLYYQDSVMVRSKGLELELLKILIIFKSLDLSNNKFEGEIPKEIGALYLLIVLNISNNHLTGLIPAAIGNLRQLESLDLSENQLSGRIPPQLGQLTFLAVLNLSHNQLVGSIPAGPQLQTFSNDSFLGNPQLCGVPLSRNCTPSPSPATKGEESSSSDVNWLIISLEVGYSVGLAALFGSLLLWRRWRIWYFKHVDMLLAYLHEKCPFI